MAIQWIEYKDKKILYSDYKGINDIEKAISQLEEEAAIIKQSKEKLLVLDDMRDFYVTDKFLERGKVLGKEVSNKVEKMAQVYSIIGVKRILVNIFIKFSGMNLKIFDNSEFQKAKDYLVS